VQLLSETNDTGAILHAEFNKETAKYQTNYTNPITGGELQDILREEEAALESKTNLPAKNQ
jgi:hypothetical protein